MEAHTSSSSSRRRSCEDQYRWLIQAHTPPVAAQDDLISGAPRNPASCCLAGTVARAWTEIAESTTEGAGTRGNRPLFLSLFLSLSLYSLLSLSLSLSSPLSSLSIPLSFYLLHCLPLRDVRLDSQGQSSTTRKVRGMPRRVTDSVTAVEPMLPNLIPRERERANKKSKPSVPLRPAVGKAGFWLGT